MLRMMLGSVVAAILLIGWTSPGRAEQFILFDATFDYTWDQAVNSRPSKSHYYINDNNFLNKARPANWLAPVDYRNGTLHVRAEVFSKPPGTQTTGWTLCYIANAGGYGCADTDYYKSTGVFEREVKMTSWWNNSQLQWDKGVKQMDLIYAINDSGSGHITNYPALKDLTTPTRVRITMVQVSAGSTYDPKIIPGAGDGGAGGITGDAGSGDAATATGGTGGDDGTGGSTGTGGTTAPGTGGAAGSTNPPLSSSTGGSPGSGGAPGVSPPPSGSNGGPVAGTCAAAPSPTNPGWIALAIPAALVLLVVTRRRNRRG
ncbi:MAG TPA: hypothetical protein VFH73_27725 [Polyangia bacterium]|nr:hypothetical protein [Polyangia bacterium]